MKMSRPALSGFNLSAREVTRTGFFRNVAVDGEHVFEFSI
jgi:hypothetical protein